VDAHVRRLLSVAFIVLSASACGGDNPRRLGDGSWYGKVVAVNVAQHTLRFAPVCRLSESGGWIAVPASDRAPVAVSLSPSADLLIYYRATGRDGHGQSADLKQLADVALGGQLPEHPPGWFVTVQESDAVSVEEDSGIRSSGEADQRRFACVWSRNTRRFVSE
jgi:hypothetical protein